MKDRVTAAEYRKLVGVGHVVHPPPYAAKASTAKPTRSDRAIGRHEAGQMNRTETAYAEHLELRRRAGEITGFAFEAISLRLARRTFYRPDFLVTMSNGSIEIHEVKGGPIEDDSAVKVKVAATMFPCFRFVIVRSRGKRLDSGWNLKDVSGGL